MKTIWDDLAQWSTATFGDRYQRGPVPPLFHLRREVDEAVATPFDLFEYADCLLLVFDACRRAGFTYLDLEGAAVIKLAMNAKRTYGPPDAEGVREHRR